MNRLHIIFIFVTAYVAVFLEAWLDFPRNLLGAQIDILPALMVYAAMTSGIVTVGLLAVCGGLWFDALSANPLGVSILPLFVIGWTVDRMRELLLRDSRYAQFIIGAAAGAFQPLATLFLMLNASSAPLLDWRSLWQWVVLAAGSGAVTPLLFAGFDRLHGLLDYQPAPQQGFRPDREIKRGKA